MESNHPQQVYKTCPITAWVSSVKRSVGFEPTLERGEKFYRLNYERPRKEVQNVRDFGNPESFRSESNQQPTPYRGVALPIELRKLLLLRGYTFFNEPCLWFIPILYGFYQIYKILVLTRMNYHRIPTVVSDLFDVLKLNL